MITRLWRFAFIGAFMVSVLAACSGQPAQAPRDTLTMSVQVPEGVGTVYLAGNLPELGGWNPAAIPLEGEGRIRSVTLPISPYTKFEYKFTLGAWNREEVNAQGLTLANRIYNGPTSLRGRIIVTGFKPDPIVYISDPAGAGIQGQLDVWLDVAAEGLKSPRTVVIWTPPNYDANRSIRYPVIYMHDGQNLFDPRLANTGVDWGVDEAMMRLVRTGRIERPAIVVGIFSTEERWQDYAPQKVISQIPQARFDNWILSDAAPPSGDAYVRFVADTLKPRIDAAYRTQPGPGQTFTAGASMGGLISLYLMTERPDVFGGAAGLSTHWPLMAGDELLADTDGTWKRDILAAYRAYFAAADFSPTGKRYWVDHGDQGLDAYYPPYFAAMLTVLDEVGFVPGASFAARAYPGTSHNEAAWRDRLPEVFAFLLSDDESL
jgi:pimeloyl-ACP methyl ester carboxylesterase